jgi:hypothetical protein
VDLDEAKLIIRDIRADGLKAVIAAVVIADSPEASFDDLIECLKRKGYIAEIGALGLYNRTKRPIAHPLVTDPDEWEVFLRARCLR